MKKSIYYIYLAFVVFALQGCPVIPQAEISGKEKGHGYIDMGTSVMWSPVNLGATTMGEYGDYYAWGETEPKQYYSILTYKWCDGDTYSFTKYVLSKDCGAEVDSLAVLELEDDAAHVNWGGDWRMPTSAELAELYKNCDWTNEGNGYRVTSKINGKSIFLAMGGCMTGTSIFKPGEQAYYWTRNCLEHESTMAYVLYLNDQGYKYYTSPRYYGCFVRPVYPK
jgi:hypothetical protein